MFCAFSLRNVLRATTACPFSTSQLPKVVRTPSVFNILTSKCASGHRSVHFFDILTSKSSPELVCFCTFSLRNVLRATTACTFSTSQGCALYILTWKCASLHNGVQFFISALASWLRTRRFSEPTFRPSEAPDHWKNTANRDFPTFSRISIFFRIYWLVVWNHLEKYESQWEGLSHILWKINMFQTTNQYKYWTQNENEWNLGFPGSTKFDPYDMFPKMNAVYSRCIWSSEASLNPSFFEEPKKHAINYRTRKT